MLDNKIAELLGVQDMTELDAYIDTITKGKTLPDKAVYCINEAGIIIDLLSGYLHNTDVNTFVPAEISMIKKAIGDYVNDHFGKTINFESYFDAAGYDKNIFYNAKLGYELSELAVKQLGIPEQESRIIASKIAYEAFKISGDKNLLASAYATQLLSTINLYIRLSSGTNEFNTSLVNCDLPISLIPIFEGQQSKNQFPFNDDSFALSCYLTMPKKEYDSLRQVGESKILD